MPEPTRRELAVAFLASAARPRPPWLRITVPPRIARFLIAAGAQEARNA